MVRELAGYDWPRMQRVLRWPLREALLAYENLLETEAREVYTHEVTVWSILAPHQKKKSKPPKLPKILREPKSG